MHRVWEWGDWRIATCATNLGQPGCERGREHAGGSFRIQRYQRNSRGTNISRPATFEQARYRAHPHYSSDKRPLVIVKPHERRRFLDTHTP